MEVGNLLGGGVDLFVVIPVDLMIKHSLGLSDIGHILPHTHSYNSILEPAIRPLNLTPGLRGQGIGDLDVTVIHYLFPLGIGLIGECIVFPPEGVLSCTNRKMEWEST